MRSRLFWLEGESQLVTGFQLKRLVARLRSESLVKISCKSSAANLSLIPLFLFLPHLTLLLFSVLFAMIVNHFLKIFQEGRDNCTLSSFSTKFHTKLGHYNRSLRTTRFCFGSTDFFPHF